ncbi:MAG: hypothetical protein N2484_13655 [Clostridia bacterium]|nr:hypothetical protein [Clostridia bacterium]
MVLAGGKNIICPVRLYCSLAIAVWSKAIYNVRAKITKGSAGTGFVVLCWRSAAVERLQQVSKVFLVVEQRLVQVL